VDTLNSTPFVKIEDLPDGSSVYEMGDDQDENVLYPNFGKVNFGENLAETLNPSELERIGSQLLEDIVQDKESRVEWEQAYLKGIKYLGFKLEEFKDVPFISACRAVDTTLSTSLIRFYATARAELFPQKGPVECELLGYPNPELEQQSDRIKSWMNYYLTEEDKEYYSDSERLLIYLGIVGCAFRKVYVDPITQKPVARFIDPQDFIVNNSCVSILSSSRLTHVLSLTKKDIKMRQMTGFYREMSLEGLNDEDEDENLQTTKTIKKLEGIQTGSYEKQSIFKIFEVHTDLVIEDRSKKMEEEQLPLPYIVSICESTRKILSIRRNWEEGDSLFKRKNYFIQYNYLPGFGLYGLGLSHLLGSNAVALTSVLRQLIDAGTLKNFPGGLKVKGLRTEFNDKPIGPGEFWDIETGGLPIQQAIMPMPYGEPSQVLNELRKELIQQTQNLALTADTQLAEDKQNAAVGTTLALLEVANLVQSSILRSLHISLSREFGLLYELFAQSFPENPVSFPIKGQINSVTRQDFTPNIRIIPVSDPSINTSSHRLIKASSLIQIAEKAPQLYDMRQVHLRACEAMKMENIEQILPPPQESPTVDPIHEVMNAMQGKASKAAIWQDHPSHITVLSGADPQGQNPLIQSLIHEHQAMQYYVEMQMHMGIQLPPLDQMQDPNIQNEVALRAAMATQQQQQLQQQQLEQMAAQQNPQPQIDQSTLMLADIQQQQEIAKTKAETDLMKEKMKLELDKYKTDIQKLIADEKNETDIAIQNMKIELDLIKHSHEVDKQNMFQNSPAEI